MCGICGQLNFDNRPVKEQTLIYMCQRMVHRGPDDEGYYINSTVGLGMRRLSIIDIESGHQPITNEDKTVWIVYNGELYNFKTLRKELISKDHLFRTQTDTEVILHAYEEWGVNCLEHFNGMFSFAICDETQQRLFLARDRLGIKPLYYFFKDGETFLFSSEIRALLESGLVPQKLSQPGLASYMTFGGIQEPLTLIENIYSLLPGHYLLMEKDKLSICCYWQVKSLDSFNKYAEPINGKLPQAYQKHLCDLLEDSVRLRMVSDVPIGAFLSGGIDSSAVVSLMSRVAEVPIKTISLSFEEKKFDESNYATRIAQIFGTEHRNITITEGDLLSSLPDALKAMDQPTVDGINTYFVSKFAKDAGLTVALSGLGGDELFAGYESFRAVPRMQRFYNWEKRLPGFAKKNLAFFCSQILPNNDRNSKIAHLLGKGINNLGHSYFLMRMFFTTDRLKELVVDSIDFWKEGPFCNYHSNLLEKARTMDPINQVSYFELSTYMKNILLRDTDVMCMAHSLEVRVPLIDYRLVEFMLSLPGSIKQNGVIPKHLLWQNLKNQLPQYVINRRKQGFTFPFERWIKKQLYTEVKETVFSSVNALKEILNQTAIENLWHEFERGRTSWHRVWILYVLKKWANEHL